MENERNSKEPGQEKMNRTFLLAFEARTEGGRGGVGLKDGRKEKKRKKKDKRPMQRKKTKITDMFQEFQS